MLDFTKITDNEMNELQRVIKANVEKSEMERYYLFTQLREDKSKLFLWCYRFLLNAYNLIEDGDLRNELLKEINLSKNKYNKIMKYQKELDKLNFGYTRISRRLDKELEDGEVDNLIDVFSILTERVNIINISRMKGVVLEGKSGEEWKKVMTSP